MRSTSPTLFGEGKRLHRSDANEQTGHFEGASQPSVRVEYRDAPRVTAS